MDSLKQRLLLIPVVSSCLLGVRLQPVRFYTLFSKPRVRTSPVAFCFIQPLIIIEQVSWDVNYSKHRSALF
jgi:hypothetical protein